MSRNDTPDSYTPAVSVDSYNEPPDPGDDDDVLHVDPFAHYASCDIDGMAMVGAFRWGGNRAAAKALGDIMERRTWKGLPPIVRFMELLEQDERAQVRGKLREAL